MPSLSDSQAESGYSDEEVEYFVPQGSPVSATGAPASQASAASPTLAGGRAAAVNGRGVSGVG